jgi:hypothetical protein
MSSNPFKVLSPFDRTGPESYIIALTTFNLVDYAIDSHLPANQGCHHEVLLHHLL